MSGNQQTVGVGIEAEQAQLFVRVYPGTERPILPLETRHSIPAGNTEQWKGVESTQKARELALKGEHKVYGHTDDQPGCPLCEDDLDVSQGQEAIDHASGF
jgi:hypothetical protein